MKMYTFEDALFDACINFFINTMEIKLKSVRMGNLEL